MAYPFVKAAFDYGARRGPILGFVVHMAEGGGTVGFLARDPARGVSVHYVIEYDGRIVQMLLESRASGSIDPSKIRHDDDATGPFGRTAARAVLAEWADDPNSAVISLELEGFARDGPNPNQIRSLVELVADVRARHPSIGLLGHRDFASYKACPGGLIPWAALGGHGRQEAPMGLHVTLPPTIIAGVLSIPDGTDSIRVADGAHYTIPTAVARPAIAAALTGAQSSPGYLVDLHGDELHFIRSSEHVSFAAAPASAPGVDRNAVLEEAAAAVAALRRP